MFRKYFSGRALCYFDLEEFENARSDYDHALRLGDQSEKTPYQKYVCELKLGYIAEAKKSLQLYDDLSWNSNTHIFEQLKKVLIS